MRWYGPTDPVSLTDIRQSGATGVVTSLHHLPNGITWPTHDIEKRRREIEIEGLTWSVVESVNVHEDIKRRSGKYQDYIGNYQQTLRHLSACGIKTVCYNFMPVVDWTRTELDFKLPNGASALRFEKDAFMAFDLFILRREDAEYPSEDVTRAKKRFDGMTQEEKSKLTEYIVAGLPGATTEGRKSLESFREVLKSYQGIDSNDFRDNLKLFLKEIIPIAEEEGIKMTIHPDDPPFSLLGLPRVVSTGSDLHDIMSSIDSPSNGLCFCTGSLGSKAENDVQQLAERFASRVNFLHLRAVQLEEDGSFYEANHLEGSLDMYAVMKLMSEEQQKREFSIPMRPDHGHRLLDDLSKNSNPGYSAIGRLKGLAELRGLEEGILRSQQSEA